MTLKFDRCARIAQEQNPFESSMCFHTLAQLERSVQVAMTQNCGRVLGIVIKGVDCSVKWNLAIIAYYIRQRDKSSSFISLMEFQVRHANLKIHADGKLFSYEMYSLYLAHSKKELDLEKAMVTFWKVRLAWKPAADSSFSANSATKAFLIAVVVVGVLRLERPQLHFPRVLQLIISSLLRKLHSASAALIYFTHLVKFSSSHSNTFVTTIHIQSGSKGKTKRRKGEVSLQ